MKLLAGLEPIFYISCSFMAFPWGCYRVETLYVDGGHVTLWRCGPFVVVWGVLPRDRWRLSTGALPGAWFPKTQHWTIGRRPGFTWSGFGRFIEGEQLPTEES